MATRQLSVESSSTVDGNGNSWLDLLPGKKLFSHLRELGSGSTTNISGNIMCTINENLFVWSREENALLTINLKRLCAAPKDNIFQVANSKRTISLMTLNSYSSFIQTLICPLLGFVDSKNYVVGLVPEGNGRYIALHCKRGVAVMQLHYHRGKNGEFSGGGESVMCRSVGCPSCDEV